MPTVTQELLKQGRSWNGSWNLSQLKALLPKREFERPYAWPAKGWRFRLIGTKVKQSQVDEFLRLKNRHLAHKTRELPFGKSLDKENYSHIDSIKQEIKCSKI